MKLSGFYGSWQWVITSYTPINMCTHTRLHAQAHTPYTLKLPVQVSLNSHGDTSLIRHGRDAE